MQEIDLFPDLFPVPLLLISILGLFVVFLMSLVD